MDVESDAVKDRWSRYIGAMGLDAVKKQACASVLLSGLSPVGVEVAKNLVLSGVKRLTLHDSYKCSYRDLSGQFFLSETHVQQQTNRAVASLIQLQQLNYYVKVDLLDEQKYMNRVFPDDANDENLYKGYDILILCDITGLDYVHLSNIN